MCETLFEADWSCVEYLEVECEWGCEEAKPEATREALVRLLCARPAAAVVVKMEGGPELVRWEGGAGRVAELYEFSSLEDRWWMYLC